ncbi:MAG: hemolysin family protein [Chitinophagales bacterium]
MSIYILILVLSILASAFFSGLELAFISANKLRVELQKQKGDSLAKVIEIFYNKPTQFLGTTLVCNNIALVVYGGAMSKLLEPSVLIWTNEAALPSLFIQTLISTLIILIFGEFVPKNLFRINPSGNLQRFAKPFYFLYRLLYPFVFFVVWLSNLLLTVLFKIKYEETQAGFGKMDLQKYMQFTNNNAHEEKKIDLILFDKALHLNSKKVRECMIPRTEIKAVEENDDLKSIRQQFIDTKHSKIIVYQDNIDNIKGYLHHQDILQNTIKVWSAIIVPEAMSVRVLLNKFMKEHRSMAWVVDEFGGTAGIITLEDIIEEVFGEIHDEHDDVFFLEKEIVKNKEYEFSARHEIDYLNEKYKLNIPQGDYETLAGYILTHHTSIPKKDDVIFIGNYEFSVISVSKNRLETVGMKIFDADFLE